MNDMPLFRIDYPWPGIENSYRQQEGLQNAYVPPEVLRLRRARKIAAEVRARHPEMQVKRIGS